MRNAGARSTPVDGGRIMPRNYDKQKVDLVKTASEKLFWIDWTDKPAEWLF